MSTRATYKFISAWRPDVVLYKHHDGYPEGAVQWLEGVRYPEAFIRKNDEAEITESHETHGDTEYRYTIKALPARQSKIWVQKRINFSHHWEVIFQGSAELFQEYYSVTRQAETVYEFSLSKEAQKDLAIDPDVPGKIIAKIYPAAKGA